MWSIWCPNGQPLVVSLTCCRAEGQPSFFNFITVNSSPLPPPSFIYLPICSFTSPMASTVKCTQKDCPFHVCVSRNTKQECVIVTICKDRYICGDSMIDGLWQLMLPICESFQTCVDACCRFGWRQSWYHAGMGHDGRRIKEFVAPAHLSGP